MMRVTPSPVALSVLLLGGSLASGQQTLGGATNQTQADANGATAAVNECAAEPTEDYNMGLHVGAIFIMLVVSLLGAFLPVALRISSNHKAILTIVKLGTFAGFGCIISTAFIHMLTPASEKLSSACLPDSWNNGYGSWAFVFVVASILGMQLIDYVVEGAYKAAVEKQQAGGATAPPGAILSVHTSHHNLAPAAPAQAAADEESADGTGGGVCAAHGGGCHALLPHAPPLEHSMVVGVYVLEAGIAFHSVLIGVSLGVTTGAAFVSLLIALSFHQAFEGFALGSAAVDAGLPSRRAFLLGVLYALTTPLGVVIGIGARTSYQANATSTLLTEGILDALSAGVLIYVGLVELMNPLMTQSKWLRSQRWWLQVLSFAVLYAGAAAMALIGKWA